MMYPYMTLNDDTEITHSEMKPDGRVKVYFETPDDNGRLPERYLLSSGLHLGKCIRLLDSGNGIFSSTSFGTMPT